MLSNSLMKTFKEYEERYLKYSFEPYQARLRKKKVIESINKYKHDTILEVGCAMDPLFSEFDDFKELIIIEPSELFCNYAEKTIVTQNKLKSKVKIINDYLENATDRLADYEFDFIVLSCVLPEIENETEFLQKLKLLCNKNTIIHIDTPNANSFHRLLAYEMGLVNSSLELSANNANFNQKKVYNIDSLSRLIIDNGFTIIDSGSFIVKPFTHDQMYKMMENKIIDEKVLAGLDKMTKYLPELGSEIYLNCKIKI